MTEKMQLLNDQDNLNGLWLESHNVMQILKVTESTLYRYRKNNTIPFKKIGGKYMYPKSFFTQLTEK